MKILLKYIVIIISLNITLLTSCKKYLDKKPDKALVIPETLDDLQALLDNANAENRQFPALLEIVADDYYVTYDDWASRLPEVRNSYTWEDKDGTMDNVYNSAYNSILYPNIVLETLPKIEINGENEEYWYRLKGSALFYRSFSLFSIAQLYCKPYNINTSGTELGIPLRLNSDFNEISVRSTIEETYNRIITDLKESISLLPANVPAPGSVKTRPNKAAAYGLLARINLAMENYSEAGKYADSCLQLYKELIDYNSLSTSAPRPFVMYNAEVILDAWSLGNGILDPASISKIDTVLYSTYDNNDLRKKIFFTSNGTNSVGFKGSYMGRLGGNFFVGIATDEMYLIRAESEARNNDITSAMNDLNYLLNKRWLTGKFSPFKAMTPEEALTLILNERRKELLMRGLRWSDLRRLNNDSRFAKTLKRILKTETHILQPNDLRYVLLFPPGVITLSKIEQNPR